MDARVKPAHDEDILRRCGGARLLRMTVFFARLIVVIARSEATKQSSLPSPLLDCFASLAMTQTFTSSQDDG
jgi:hypothetical protein